VRQEVQVSNSRDVAHDGTHEAKTVRVRALRQELRAEDGLDDARTGGAQRRATFRLQHLSVAVHIEGAVERPSQGSRQKGCLVSFFMYSFWQ
jgi:hypothetical protein